MTAIQLFVPPVHHYARVWYRLNPALGLPIIAAVLREEGHSVSVWDMEALQITPKKLGARFAAQKKHWPGAVGFTVTTQNRRGARECVEALRGVEYEGYIVVGGPGVSILNDAAPAEMLAAGADCVVTGECEGNVTEIFAEKATGVVKGECVDIDDVPGPLWQFHYPKPNEYMGNQPKIGHPEGIAMWSRGCPWNCRFCGNPIFGHQKTRLRSPRLIKDDMLDLRAFSVKSVFVYDDELVTGDGRQQEWLGRACREVAPLGMTWKCQGRVSRKLEEKTLKYMRGAGCRAIMWGVESFSDKVLRDLHKGTTEEDIWHSLRLAQKAGIGNWVFLMVGSYGETREDLSYTERRLRQAKEEGLVQWLQVTVCTPAKGTELWRLAEEEGWLVEPPETGPHMAQAYAGTPWLTKQEIGRWTKWLKRAGR